MLKLLLFLFLLPLQAIAIQQCLITNLPDVDNCLTPASAIGTPLVENDLKTTPFNLDAITHVGDGGAFRFVCKPAWYGQYDPMVRPGEPGMMHHHTGAGNTAITAYTNLDNIRTVGGNSTCGSGTTNLSSYWWPSFIDTQDHKAIEPFQAVFYYKRWYNMDKTQVKPIPVGLRMIAGDAKRTTVPSQYDDTYKFTCNQSGNSKTIPACAQNQLLSLVISFPNCVKQDNTLISPANPYGMVLDSTNHKDHVSYPLFVHSLWAAGNPNYFVCPTTHPIQIPHITYNLHYTMQKLQGSAIIDLACTMGTTLKGVCAHADYVAGIEQQAATDIAELINRGKDGGTISYTGN